MGATSNNYTEEQFTQLQRDNESLVNELNNLKLYFSELESTNNHLISATWREREMKQKLAETIQELNNTKLIVESQNKRITESINYSRKIQIAINATENDIQKLLPNSFVLYKPKDVISGDFPWLYTKNEFLYLAAVDCTGHGVPGAMMSMIGNLLLNDIINDDEMLTPGEVLNRLHAAVVKTLKQDVAGNSSSDGMDVALIRLNLNTNELLFSGAHRPLLLQRNNTIEQIGGDKFPIGGIQYKGKNNFTNTELKLQKKDRILIFSDGLPDQIGGTEGKKFMSRQIKEISEQNSAAQITELKNIYDKQFLNWKGENKQIDDVLLIGFEI